MFENIRLSFQGIWSHKMRSFLTMLGIIIGIAAIIAIISTINGTNEMIKQNMMGNSRHTVKVQLYQDDMIYDLEWQSVPEGIPFFDESVREEILEVKDIIGAAFYNSRSEYSESIFYQNNVLGSCQVIGIDQNYFGVAGYQMEKGRMITEADNRKNRQVVILDEISARSLFPDTEPLGKTIEIHGEAFTVIGICRATDTYEPVINSIEEYYTYNMNNSTTGLIFVPYKVWGTLYRFDEAQSLMIRATGSEEMAKAGGEAAEILNSMTNISHSSIAYRAEDLLAQVKQIQDLQSSTNNMLIWVACISLLVGGIGVMNIMLVSVTERTREIGLKKAIGARKGRILGQFLTEAAILTSLGGILGVAAGVTLAEVISKMTSTPVAVSIPSIIVSVGFSTLIGIIFGLLPSISAANLNPIDALRHE